MVQSFAAYEWIAGASSINLLRWHCGLLIELQYLFFCWIQEAFVMFPSWWTLWRQVVGLKWLKVSPSHVGETSKTNAHFWDMLFSFWRYVSDGFWWFLANFETSWNFQKVINPSSHICFVKGTASMNFGILCVGAKCWPGMFWIPWFAPHCMQVLHISNLSM